MANQADIESHYDEDPTFFRHLLGPTMVYSCANWADATDLETAQRNKVRKLLAFAGAEEARRLIDLGCGWGSALAIAAETLPRATHLDGVTLSRTQARYAEERLRTEARARVVHGDIFAPSTWATGRYDAAISIGAFEHLASARLYAEGRHIDRYRDFFTIARDLVDGRLGLQTIVATRSMDSMNADDARDYLRYLLFVSRKIFPNSLIPQVKDIEAATHGLYEIERIDVHHDEYRRTLAAWRSNLETHKEQIAPRIFETFVKFLEIGGEQFSRANLGLAQIRLRPARA